jgi:hypothetical protein
MRTLRLAAAVALVACAAASLVLAADIPTRPVKGDPGPRVFPVAAAGLVLAGAVAAMVIDIRGPGSAPTPWRQGVLTAAATIGYLILLTTAGFLIATMLFLLGVSQVLDPARSVRPPVRWLTALAIPLILWLVFGVLFDVSLPSGLAGF